MKPIKIKFNVAELTKYGNAGGTKVIMFPNEKELNPEGIIELQINQDLFELGEYIVEFKKK